MKRQVSGQMRTPRIFLIMTDICDVCGFIILIPNLSAFRFDKNQRKFVVKLLLASVSFLISVRYVTEQHCNRYLM